VQLRAHSRPLGAGQCHKLTDIDDGYRAGHGYFPAMGM
jgi:hypothetical protein